jgi:penicillin amidase
VDLTLREAGFRRDAEAQVRELDEEVLRPLRAYAEGVNAYLSSHARPLEFWLVDHRPAPWQPVDTLTLVRLLSYVGLAEIQIDTEKLLVQMLQRVPTQNDSRARASPVLPVCVRACACACACACAGSPVPTGAAVLRVLQEAFGPGLLDELDEELLAQLREARVARSFFPRELAQRFVPSLRASNNWAANASRSRSGGALWAMDPHLDLSALPGFWYEVAAHTPKNYYLGVTIPGMPARTLLSVCLLLEDSLSVDAVVMGRNRDVAFGFTYGFADQSDYYLEECRDEECRDESGWAPLQKRVEVIKRRGQPDLRVVFYHTANGVIERDDPEREGLEPGLYLSRAFAPSRFVSDATVAAFPALLRSRSVSGPFRSVCRSLAARIPQYLQTSSESFATSRRSLFLPSSLSLSLCLLSFIIPILLLLLSPPPPLPLARSHNERGRFRRTGSWRTGTAASRTSRPPWCRCARRGTRACTRCPGGCGRTAGRAARTVPSSAA